MRYQRECIPKIKFQYLNAFACFMQILTRLSAGMPTAEILIRRWPARIHTALSHLSLLANPGTRRTLAQNSIAGRKKIFAQTRIAHFLPALVMDFSSRNTACSIRANGKYME
jgi:hypothetical protein